MNRIFMIAASLILTACCAVALAEDVRLQGGGSTFLDPIYQRWLADYQKLHPEARIDYQALGSLRGIKGLNERTFDFAGSDLPLNPKQTEDLGGEDKIVEIPVVGGAVATVYNLPGFSRDLKLDGPSIADIYLGKIKNWNDAKIAALNPGAKLPDLAITPIYRPDASGTTNLFTSYLCTQSEAFKDKVGAANRVEWPVGEAGTGGAGLPGRLAQTKGGIGYLELGPAAWNKIPFALLKNKDGNFVKPSPESAALAGRAAAEKMRGAILAAPLLNQPGKEVYPISGFTYIIVYKDLNNLKSKEQAEALAGFLKWATAEGQRLAPEMGYAPLDPAVQAKVAEAIKCLTFKGQRLK